jgi:hypothetical protein
LEKLQKEEDDVVDFEAIVRHPFGVLGKEDDRFRGTRHVTEHKNGGAVFGRCLGDGFEQFERRHYRRTYQQIIKGNQRCLRVRDSI